MLESWMEILRDKDVWKASYCLLFIAGLGFIMARLNLEMFSGLMLVFNDIMVVGICLIIYFKLTANV